MKVTVARLHESGSSRAPNGAAAAAEDARTRVLDRSIGDVLLRARKLTAQQIDQVLAHQREQGIRFGEAAVALDFVSDDDVVWALSQQFHYPYAPGQRAANPELVIAACPFTEEAEVFRELRSQLLLGVLAPDEPRRALAIVSPNIGDGKSYLAANLAVAFAQLGGRTLLIDADMRTPRQQEVFKLGHPRAGLSSILSGRAEESVIQRIRDLPGLFVLPVGTIPPNPLELVQRSAFGLLMQELLDKFDHVVVDTAAGAHGADSRVIAARCGAVLAIGRRGRTRMKAMNSLLNALGKGPAELAGVILNEF